MDPCLTLVVLSLLGSVELHQAYIAPNVNNHITFHERFSAQKVKRSATHSKDCHASTLRAMGEFDISKFTGTWYELAKTSSNYFDTNDGVWRIAASNDSSENLGFLFSGRSKKNRCIRPISGILRSWDSNPGILTLKYRTYSTYVSEVIRLLHTDYESIAVLYACAATDSETNSCRPEGLFGSIWTRHPHVNIRVFQNAARILERACIDKSMIQVKNLKGPCRIQDVDSKMDTYPVPSFCYHAMDPGEPCEAEIMRFFFDRQAMKCKPFTYTGCGGNGNNFILQGECENQCMGKNFDYRCDGQAPCALLCPPCCIRDTNGCVKCECGRFPGPLTTGPCSNIPGECPKKCKLEKDLDGCDYCQCENAATADDGSGDLFPETSTLNISCKKEESECPEECNSEKDIDGCFHCICEKNTVNDNISEENITSLDPWNDEQHNISLPETKKGNFRLTMAVSAIATVIIIATFVTVIIVFAMLRKHRRC